MSIQNILIVEDEEDIRALLETYLLDKGFAVLQAETGPKAIDIVNKEYVDLVFLDIKLPGMDGVDVLKSIKEYNSDIAVIMLSGHATEEIAKETLANGAFDYIKKPVDLGKILEVISCVELVHI